MSVCRRGEPEVGGGVEVRVTMSTVHSPLRRYCRMEALQVDFGGRLDTPLDLPRVGSAWCGLPSSPFTDDFPGSERSCSCSVTDSKVTEGRALVSFTCLSFLLGRKELHRCEHKMKARPRQNQRMEAQAIR